MASFLKRWRTPLVTGIGIWLLSFPLLAGHPAALPVHASAVAFAAPDRDSGIRSWHPSRDRLVVGTLAAPAQPAPAAAPAAASTAFSTWAPPAAPAAPAVQANWIVIPRLGLSQPVGWYGDCLGRAAVPRWGAWRWSCAGANNVYVMAHNPGVFTPILNLHAGDLVRYGDPAGRVHTYRVSFTTIVSNTQLWPLAGTGASSLTLQTCWTWDGSRDFIVRAIEI